MNYQDFVIKSIPNAALPEIIYKHVLKIKGQLSFQRRFVWLYLRVTNELCPRNHVF